MSHSTNAALEKLSQVFTEIPFNRILGLRLDELSKESISIHFDMKNELIGNYMQGILHGGVIASVLDMAGGIATLVSAIMKRPEASLAELVSDLSKSSTINLHINYLRVGKGQHFTAKAFTLHAGNKITTARMELFNEENILIATGSGTYLTA